MNEENLKLVQKWHGTGLLNGIEDELRKIFVVKNLESASKWLVKLANEQRIWITSSELFSGIILPLTARISRNQTFDEPIESLLEKIIPIFNFFDEFIVPADRKLRDRIFDLETRIIDLLELALIIYLETEQIKVYEKQKPNLSENN